MIITKRDLYGNLANGRLAEGELAYAIDAQTLVVGTRYGRGAPVGPVGGLIDSGPLPSPDYYFVPPGPAHYETVVVRRDIGGIRGGYHGRKIRLLCAHDKASVTLYHEHATATPANRIKFPDNVDHVILANSAVHLIWSGFLSRWVLIGESGFVPTGAATTWKFTGLASASPGSSQNDYNPAGLSTATMLDLNPSADIEITGLQGGVDGRILMIRHVGSANAITLPNESTSSTAGNRFANYGSSHVRLTPKTYALFQYRTQSQDRWIYLAGTQSEVTRGSATLGSDYTLTTSFANTGLSVTLPPRGDYRIWAHVRSHLHMTVASGWIELRFHDGTAAISNSEVLAQFVPDTANNHQLTTPMETVVSVGASAVTLALQARYQLSGGTLGTGLIRSDANGRTQMFYERLP